MIWGSATLLVGGRRRIGIIGFATDPQAYPMPGMTLQGGSRQEQINHQTVRAYTEGIGLFSFSCRCRQRAQGIPVDRRGNGPREGTACGPRRGPS